LFPFVGQELANRSKKKSNKLRAVEDGLNQLQEKDHQIGKKIYKNFELRNQLDTIKQERTREVWLLKKEIEDLKNKNKLQAKTHRGDTLSTALSYFAIHEK
jgi:hypothetical protein